MVFGRIFLRIVCKSLLHNMEFEFYYLRKTRRQAYYINCLCNTFPALVCYELQQSARTSQLPIRLFLLPRFCARSLKHAFSSQLFLASGTKKVIVPKKEVPLQDAGTFTCEKEFTNSYKYLHSVKVYVVSDGETCIHVLSEAVTGITFRIQYFYIQNYLHV